MGLLTRILPEGLRQQAILKLHAGDRYICPFCSYAAKDLERIGSDFPVLVTKDVIGGGSRDAGCYKCGSSDRERLLYAYLMEELSIAKENSGLRILHVAPEKRLTKVLLGLGLPSYVCGDKKEEGYEYGNHVIDVDILDLDFPEGNFDLILCNHVLEHIPDDIKAMKELHRVLANGGKAVLQVPISGNSSETYEDFSITSAQARIDAFGQFDHVRIYGQDYVDRLTEAGFKVERINLFEKYPQYGLNPKEDLFICHK